MKYSNKYINNLTTHNGLVGKLGEDYACKHLESLGHQILERNLKNKLGEIDIVTLTKDSRETEKIHIVEVKTSQSKIVRPEENMHIKKMRKLAKLAEIYAGERLFSIDFVGVMLNNDLSLCKITYLENLEIY
jgi:putative endonuclease